LAELLGQWAIREYLLNCFGEGLWGLGVYEHPGISHNLWQAGCIATDDRCATGHGLDYRDSEPLIQGGKNKDIRSIIVSWELRVGKVGDMGDVVIQIA
jgi:hypothetical protein